MSLLVNDKNQQQHIEIQDEPEEHDENSLLEITSVPSVDNEMEESVIYVTYDVDESEPAFHILDPDQVTYQRVPFIHISTTTIRLGWFHISLVFFFCLICSCFLFPKYSNL